MTATPQEFVDAIRDLLIDRGPMHVDALRTALGDQGLVIRDDEDWLDALADECDPPIMPIGNGVYAWMPALLEGRVFTHRLGASELAHDFLRLAPDLLAFEVLLGDPPFDRLVTGTSVALATPFDFDVLEERGIPADLMLDTVLLLAPGTLAGFGLGDVVALTATADGFLLEGVPDLLGLSLGRAMAAVVGEFPGVALPLEPMLWSALANDDSLARQPEEPLGEQLVLSNVACRERSIASPDFDFDAAEAADRVEELVEMYDLFPDEAEAVSTLLVLHGEVAAVARRGLEADPEDLGRTVSEFNGQEVDPSELTAEEAESALDLLFEPAVAEAFWREAGLLGTPADSMALLLLGETMLERAPRHSRVAARWLKGKVLEAIGRTLEAEAEFKAAESLNDTWPLALESLARYASDRGDAVRALSLLRRAEAEEGRLFPIVEAFQPKPGPDLPRNAPCWCGSGRKFKQCHMRDTELPLEDRAAWLYQKSALGLTDGPYLGLVAALALARAGSSGQDDDWMEKISDPLVADVALFEGGAFADFLETRGVLLPADEQAMGEQWLLARRSLYEVVGVQPGESLTVRDLRTGDVVDVRECTASRSVKIGQYHCMRVVPAGETMQIFGGMEPLSPSDGDELLDLLDDEDADASDLVTFLSRRLAPPTL